MYYGNICKKGNNMISVCLATYNGEKYLRQQVDSIMLQLGKEDELVVSDDGSTDTTVEILKSYKDSRIKILHNLERHGVNHNFENALRNAQGDYIFLADQDDVWLPGKVERCKEIFNDADCIVHDCFITDDNLNVTSKSLFKELNAGKGVLKNFKKNSFTGCCMAFTREVLKKVLPFPKTKLFYHDQWIGLVATISFKTKFYKEPLIYFRRHTANTSSAADKSQHSLYAKIASRLALLYALLIRYLIGR